MEKCGSASSSLFSDAAVGEWASASMNNKPPKGLGRSSAEFVATWLASYSQDKLDLSLGYGHLL